ncbi:MAG: hypothetical protein GDA53_05325 [Rhodobacteraceae bacterium]|nr:hypothetical protein [Paracoccaceae bacterium]
MNVPAHITASAPGSAFIIGEHAVVYGHPAMVCAIEGRVKLHAAPRSDGMLSIRSDLAGPGRFRMKDLKPAGPYRFIRAALALFAAQLPGGVEVSVASDINPAVGLGSSAAVTIAALGAFARLAGGGTDGLHTRALRIVRTIQGRGSGADLAASLTGGLLAYRLPEEMLIAAPDRVRAEMAALPAPPALALGYCGYKMPTAEVLAKIAVARAGNRAFHDALYTRMGAGAAAAIAAARARDWQAFARALNAYQGMMEQLGVSDGTLGRLVRQARGTAGVMAAKISGAGLGDCVLAVGAVPDGFAPVPVASEGLKFHD